MLGTVSGAGAADLVRGLGADDVIDYRTEDVVAGSLELTDGKGVDLVHELVISVNLPADVKLVAKGGRIVVHRAGARHRRRRCPSARRSPRTRTLLFMNLNNAGRAGVAAIAAEIARDGGGRQGQAGDRGDAAAGRGTPRARAARRDHLGKIVLLPLTPPGGRAAASVALAVAADRFFALLAQLEPRQQRLHHGEQRLEPLLLAERLEQLLLERRAEVDGRRDAERERALAGRLVRVPRRP